LELLHHSSPASSVLEVAAEAEGNDSTPTKTTTPLFQRSDLACLAKTWDVTTASRRSKTETEQNPSIQVLDFGQDLPEDMAQNHYDLLVAADLGQGSYASNLAEAVGRMCQVVKEGGTICILVPDSVLERIQSVLEGNTMETTLSYRADAGLGLVISKKCPVPKTNGTTIGMTNGTANGMTSGTAGSEEMQITLVLAPNPTEVALAVASRLIASLRRHGYETRVFSLGSDMSSLAGKSCISLVEIQNPLLREVSAEDFESVKKLILETKDLFWVTALDDPGASMIDGLVRVVRNETPGLNLRVFHADEPSSLAAPAERLAELMTKAFLWAGEDNEFQVRGDLVHTCRVEEDTALNEEINGLLPGASKTVASLPLGKVQYPVKLCVRTPGMLSSVCLEPDDSAAMELEPDFVEIQTMATALK
jgi:hypothetical protein